MEISEKLIERLDARMKEMGFNPSSLAVEANLGRSAVRDILSGKAKNPGYATLLSLTVPLECTLSYLLGETEQPYPPDNPNEWAGLESKSFDLSGFLETGIFRKKFETATLFENEASDANIYGLRERRPIRNYRRFMGRDLLLYKMLDGSMDLTHILKDDVLAVLTDREPQHLPLENGMIIVALNEPDGLEAIELSARQVRIDGVKTRLESRSSRGVYQAVEIASKTNEPNVYQATHDAKVTIVGPVVHLSRNIIV